MRIVCCLYISLVTVLYGQQQLQLVRTWDINSPGVAATDYIGNFYLQADNQLYMFNRFDTLYRKFSIINLSTITQIDASNALKIQLYYRELGKIVYLDNNISDFTNAISLNDMGLAQSTLTASSYDNGFWIYLPGQMSLFRYNQQLTMVTSIESISRFMRTTLLEPTFMKEYSNMVYLYFPDYGVVVFDVFGAYVQTIPLKTLQYPDIQSGELIHYQNDSLYFRPLTNWQDYKVQALPALTNLQNVKYSAGKVYMLTSSKLYIYKLINNQ